MTRYVVLRKPRGQPPAGAHVLDAAEAAAAAGELPVVEVADLPHATLPSLRADPSIQLAVPLMPTRLIAPLPAASRPGWGIAAVGADRSRFSGSGVRVAVLDTGIDAAHPAFAGMKLLQRDFSGTGDGDRAGHGTHCAGTIFGRDVAGTRIGVARGVQEALVAKVLGDDGSGSSDMLFQAMLWAMQQGADIVSMSLGFDFPGMVARLVADGWPADLATSTALEAYRGNLRMFDAIMELLQAHAAFGTTPLVVAAAGNESRREVNERYRIAASLPAAAERVVSVAAVDLRADVFDVADFSNSMATLCAPGVDITSAAAGGGLASSSGTSMACPHVAGVAALWCESVRSAGQTPAAPLVRARLVAAARQVAFAPRVQEADVGAGLATAPE